MKCTSEENKDHGRMRGLSPRTLLFISITTLLVVITARVWIGYWAAREFMLWRILDVSQWVDSGDRILAGQWPDQDFYGSYGPLLYGWAGVWYWMGGANWFAAQFQLEVISPVVCLLMAAWIALKEFKTLPFRWLFVVTVGILGLDHFYWCPAVREWIPLTTVVLAISAARKGELRFFALSSGLCGLGILFSPETGLAAMVACGVLAWGQGRTASSGRIRWVVAAGAILIPLLLGMIFFPGVVFSYLHTVPVHAAQANWLSGNPFPTLDFSWKSAYYLWPFAFLGIAGSLMLIAFVRSKDALIRREKCYQLSLLGFGAVLLRTILGRTDDSHVLFALPPLLLLLFRLCEQAERFPIYGRVMIATGCLVPAFVQTWKAGEIYLAREVIQNHYDENLVPLANEGVRAPELLVKRINTVTTYIQERVPHSKCVLSLPLPIYAHLAHRPSALPLIYPGHLLIWTGGPSRAIATLEERKVSTVVMDLTLYYSTPQLMGRKKPVSEDPFSQPLEAVSAADEAITRDLRAYLRSHFAVEKSADNLLFLTRRTTPLAPRTEQVIIHHVPQTRMLPGKKYQLEFPGLQSDELRIQVECIYSFGMSSLAKTYIVIKYWDDQGVVWKDFLPVPPAYLQRDLRFPIAPVRLRKLTVEVLSPGSLNPVPRSTNIKSIEFISTDP